MPSKRPHDSLCQPISRRPHQNITVHHVQLSNHVAIRLGIDADWPNTRLLGSAWNQAPHGGKKAKKASRV